MQTSHKIYDNFQNEFFWKKLILKITLSLLLPLKMHIRMEVQLELKVYEIIYWVELVRVT